MCLKVCSPKPDKRNSKAKLQNSKNKDAEGEPMTERSGRESKASQHTEVSWTSNMSYSRLGTPRGLTPTDVDVDYHRSSSQLSLIPHHQRSPRTIPDVHGYHGPENQNQTPPRKKYHPLQFV